jgi:excinuclease UvrABC nuclease subunit
MDREARRRFEDLSRDVIPTSPGVYALYRDGERTYVGKAKALRDRIWGNHARTGTSMTNSAMRRNVAELLGIATASEIKKREHVVTDADAAAVTSWLGSCEIAWLVCKTAADAIELEAQLKAEFKPPLTKR